MTNKAVYGIYGASGFGKEIMPLIRNKIKDGDYLCFIDDSPNAETLNGVDVLTYFDFLQLDFNNKYVSIAVADSSVRELISQRLKENNISILDIKAENVMIYDKVSIDPGSILCAFTTLTSNIKIGKFFHANLYSYVAHDCLIGDFVTFAPGVKCNGNVVIEDYAYIGTGAIIKQGSAIRPLTIGEGAVVGMGAVVTKNVPPGVTVIGNPAAILTKDMLRDMLRRKR